MKKAENADTRAELREALLRALECRRVATSQYEDVRKKNAERRAELAHLRKDRAKADLQGHIGDGVDTEAAAARDVRIGQLERLTSEGALEAAAELVEEHNERLNAAHTALAIALTSQIREIEERDERILRELAPTIAQVEATHNALRVNAGGAELDFRLPSAVGHGNLLRALPTPKPAVPDALLEDLRLLVRAERMLARPVL
jgi:hypothetical protein